MSFLARGRRRGRLAAALVGAGALLAFQGLAVLGASTASAAVFPAGTSCTYGSGVLTVTMTLAGNIGFQVAGDGSGRILVGTVPLPLAATDTTLSQCVGATADATVANTTSIMVIGDGSTAQGVAIEMYKAALSGNTIAWGDINWTISLGSDLTDVLEISNQGAAVSPTNSIDVTLGVSGIDLNSDANLDVTVSGVDTTEVFGGAANDTIWGEGDTTTGAPYTGKLVVDGGDDTAVGCTGFSGDAISGGAGDDVLSGGADTSTCNEDYVDYSAATGPANVSLTTGVAVAPGLGIDTLAIAAPATVGPDGATMGVDGVGNSFEDIGGSANNDTLTGDAGAFGNDILPGAGDDTVDCVAGGYDLIDYSDSSTGVTVDMNKGTVTGDGNDTFTHCDNAVGSDENDTFVDDTTTNNDYYGLGGNDAFDQGADPAVGDADTIYGGSGTDLVDYSQRTDDLSVDLTGVTPSGDLGVGEADTIFSGVENAKLGSGDDAFMGNAFNNVVWPEGGANTLNGGVGGIDTLNYSEGYDAGVTVNMTGGGPTGGNADSAVNFENAIGTDFNDTMLGTDVVVGTNGANYLYGGKGNDSLMGNAGPDVLVGGPGNDSERGGSGDDTLKGNAGNDRLRGGSGDDDIFGGPGKDTCFGGPGDDFIKNCMKKHHHHHQLQAPVAKFAAKLV